MIWVEQLSQLFRNVPSPANSCSALMRFAALLAILSCNFSDAATAAEPVAPNSKPLSAAPLKFRRLMLPEELITTWFSGYRPIKRDAFDAEIKRINERAIRAAQTSARITRATYRARWNGQDQLVGEAVLEIARNVPEPTTLSLSPCALAIGNLTWADDAGTIVPCGTTSDGELIALVDRDASLRFTWSARGTMGENGEFTIGLALPRSPATRIQLDLPPTVTPQLDEGVVVTRPDAAKPGETSPREGSPSLETWEVELGGHTQFELQLVPRSSSSAEAKQSLLRESTRYRLTSSGLELRTTFQLAADRARMGQLNLQVTPGLHIAAAQIGDRVFALARHSASSSEELVQVVLDEPLTGFDQELVVIGYAPLVMGQPWTLPRVRPSGTVWQEGQASIEVIEPLVLAGLDVHSGTETKIEPLPAPEHGESRLIQFWDPEGKVEVRLTYPPKQVEAEVATSIRFSEPAATAKSVIGVQSRQGTSFAIRGVVSPGWTIDSVQTEPAEVLESFSTQGSPRQELLIRLRRGIPADQQWRLVIRAHRRTPLPDRPVRAEIVRVVEFPELNVHENLLALSAEPPLRMTLTGDENLERLDPRSVAERHPDLASNALDTIVFSDQRTRKDWTVTLSREQPRFAAQVEHTVEVDAKQCTESFELHCEPNQSFISRFLVHLSHSDPAPLEWELKEAGDNLLSPRLVSASPDAIGGESWELTLSRPMNRPFTVRATRQQTLDQEISLSFVSIPEAASQTGTLRVHSVGGGPLDIRVRNLQPIATSLPDSQRMPTLRAAYRYAPSQEVAATIARLPGEDSPAPAWLWLQQTNVRYDASGELLHEARLHIENTGLASLEVLLPAEAALVRVAVDHGVLSHPTVTGGKFAVPLPKDRRFPLVSILYRTRQTPAKYAGKVNRQEIVCQIPCLQRESLLWLPDSFSVTGDVAEINDPTWDERLFGIRICAPGQQPFDPFDLNQWKQVGSAIREVFEPKADADSADSTKRGNSSVATAWSGVAPAIGSEERACGWVAHAFPTNLNAELVLYRRDLSRAVTGGMLLMTVGVAATVARFRRRVLLLSLTALAAVVLIVPVEFVSVLRGLFLGTAFGIAWSIFPSRKVVPDLASESSIQRRASSQSFVVASTTGGLWLVLFCTPSAWLEAQEAPAAKTATEGILTYNVLSPIDDKQQPKGDYLFVPQPMYDAIYSRANETFGSQYGSWLESAEYRVAFTANDEGDSRLLVREFSADYSVRTLLSGTTINLPWRRDRFRITEASLDGEPIALPATGATLTIPVDSPKQHRLKIIARPLQTTPELSGEFVTKLPICPRSRLVVSAAGSLDRLSLPGAMGVTSRDDSAGELAVELGAIDELKLRWSAPVTKNQAIVDSELAELLWFHVQGNSLTVDGKFRFSARTGAIGQVVFQADRRLKLLPIAKDQPIANVEVQPGETQLIRCWLDRPYQEVTLRLSFAMDGNSGVGRWLLPRIAGQATHRAPLWFGITATEGVSAEIATTAASNKIAPSEFLSAWQEVRDAPQQAYSTTSDLSQWQLAVKPVPSRATVQENQSVLVGGELASFQYEAIIAVEQGRMSRFNLYLPTKFEPRDVVVLHDDANRLMRWSQKSDREISVFLTVPLSGELRVLVKGVAPLPRTDRLRLPLIAIADAASRQRRVDVFQDDDVRLEVGQSAGLVAEPRVALRSGGGRFIAGLVGTDPEISQPSLELSMKPNQPRVNGSVATTMTMKDDKWQVETDLHVDVQAGSIDAIRLQIPEEMADPIQIFPPLEQQQYPAPGERARLLVARLPAPVDRELNLKIVAELAVPPGDPIRVPEMRVLDVASLKRYVVLPTRLQRQKAMWDLSGLQSAELPEEHGKHTGSENVAVYQVVGPRVQAVLREVERVTGTPQVHLADYQIRWTADYRLRGVATFYLEPSRLTEIEFAMPPSTKPIHFKVAGLPVAGRMVDGQHWRVSVGPELLPQLVEVLFEGSVSHRPADTNAFVFAAPGITGIPVTQTLWTVEGPGQFGEGQLALEHIAVNNSKTETIRREVTESLRQRGLADALRMNPLERDAWRADWDLRIRHLDARQDRANSNFDKSKSLLLAGPTDLAGQWLIESNSMSPQITASLRGEAMQLIVSYSTWSWRHFAGRIAPFLLLLGAVVSGSWLTRQAWCHELWCRSPQLFIAMAGFLWWLLFVPSALGLVILLLAAVSAIRPRWKPMPAP